MRTGERIPPEPYWTLVVLDGRVADLRDRGSAAR